MLFSAAYGLVNANAKWQKQSYDCLKLIVFTMITYILQLLYMKRNGLLTAIVVKAVDDVIFGGEDTEADNVIIFIQRQFNLGTVVYGPEKFFFYGLQFEQDSIMEITIDANYKLNTLEPFPITLGRRKCVDDRLNPSKQKSFISLNSSLGWLGISSSPLCANYISHIHQVFPSATKEDLIFQINSLRTLKLHGTTVHFTQPPRNVPLQVSIVVFSDSSRKLHDGQTSIYTDLLLESCAKNNHFIL